MACEKESGVAGGVSGLGCVDIYDLILESVVVDHLS